MSFSKLVLILSIILAGSIGLTCQSPSDGINLKKANIAGNLADPSVSTASGSTITVVSMISDNVLEKITERGFLYGAAGSELEDLFKRSVGAGTGGFTLTITDLKATTDYVVQAYAIAEGTMYKSNETLARTKSAEIPKLEATANASSITKNSAQSGGIIFDDGGVQIIVRGLVWSRQENPVVSFNEGISENGSGKGPFTSQITGLDLATTYFVRSFATNAVGTGYGAQISFSTHGAPVLDQTTPATNITGNRANSGGNVLSDGFDAVTARGIVWNTSENPTIDDKIGITQNGTGTGVFSSTLTGLLPGTQYYVRSYASNSIRTSYGAQISFSSLRTPSLATTLSASNVNAFSAVTGGTVISDGGTAIFSRGVVWSTVQNPSIELRLGITQNGTGTGSFTSNITDLLAGQKYYVRSYATNNIGTGYGEEISFTTNTLQTGESITNSVGIQMIYIPEGSFYMGSTSGNTGENPVRKVTISKGFFISKYEITQAQWQAVMGNNPSYFKGNNLPVDNVSWVNANSFMTNLNLLEGSSKYRLPTEAEWEYAAHAGAAAASEGSKWHFGNNGSQLTNYAWFASNSSQTQQVGLKLPNSWGLYDMHGNVWEWVQDSYDFNYYGSNVNIDPQGPSVSGDLKVMRGGSWDRDENFARTAYRFPYGQNTVAYSVGFRIVRIN